MNLDAQIDKYFASFSDWLSHIIFMPVNLSGVEVPILILLLIILSIVFTIYLNGIGIWGFKHSLWVIFGKKTRIAQSVTAR